MVGHGHRGARGRPGGATVTEDTAALPGSRTTGPALPEQLQAWLALRSKGDRLHRGATAPWAATGTEEPAAVQGGRR